MPTTPEDTSFISRWSRRKALVRQAQGLPSSAAAVADVGAGADADASPAAEPAPVQDVPSAAAPVAVATESGAAPAPFDMAAQATHPAASALANPTGPAAAPVRQPPSPPLPTMADVAALTRDSDFSRFVARTVQPDVKNAALSKLFTDPHFNVMDGLDTYIDDYGKPDPLPEGMLRKLAHAHVLGLFDHEKETAELTAGVTVEDAPSASPEANAIPAEDLQAHPETACGTAPHGVPDLEPASASANASVPASESESALTPALATEPAPHENTRLQLQPHHGAGRPGVAASAVQDPGCAH
jgi:hypothetical protein